VNAIMYLRFLIILQYQVIILFRSRCSVRTSKLFNFVHCGVLNGFIRPLNKKRAQPVLTGALS
jgi:hypothetical protein